MDRLTFVMSDLFAFFLFFAENIALRDHQELYQRILIPAVGTAVKQHDLASLYDAVGIFRIKCPQFMITKVLCQTFRPGSGCTQQDHAFSLFLPLLQILHQKFKAVVVGVDTAYIDAEMLRKMPLCSCRLQHTQPHAAMFLQFFGCHLALTEQVHLSRQHIPFFQSVCHALPELLFDRLCFLPEAVRLI